MARCPRCNLFRTCEYSWEMADFTGQFPDNRIHGIVRVDAECDYCGKTLARAEKAFSVYLEHNCPYYEHEEDDDWDAHPNGVPSDAFDLWPPDVDFEIKREMRLGLDLYTHGECNLCAPVTSANEVAMSCHIEIDSDDFKAVVED